MPATATRHEYPHQQHDAVTAQDLAEHYTTHTDAYHPGLRPIVERMIEFAEPVPTAEQLVADSLSADQKSADEHHRAALQHVRESAAVISSLSRIGTAGTEGILAEKESEAAEAKVQAEHERFQKLTAEQQHEEDAKRGLEVVARLDGLLEVLPTAQKGHIRNLDRLVNYVFDSERLEDIRQLETQVLWLPRVDFDPQKVHGDPESGEHDRYRYATKDDDVSFLNVNETLVPFYLVGERSTPRTGKYDTDSRDDAYVDLLLVKAEKEDGKPPELVIVTTSSRLKDAADELAIEELGDPVSEDELDWRYLNKKGGYSLKGGILGSINTVFGNRKPHKRHASSDSSPRNRTVYIPKGGAELSDPPRLGKSRRDRYWNKQKRKINETGLPADIRPTRDTELTGTFFDEFNVDFNTQKLAILLGREAEYQKSLGS